MNAVAKEIMTYLGSNKFIAMTGAYNLMHTEDSLMMNLRKNQSGANTLIIESTPVEGKYTMIFKKVYIPKMKKDFTMTKAVNEVVRVESNVSYSELQKKFTEVTGYYTHL